MDQMNTFNNHHDQIVVTPIDDQVFGEFMFATKSPFLHPDVSSSSLIPPSYSTNSNSRCTPNHHHHHHHHHQNHHHQNSNNVNMMMNNGFHQTQPYYPSQELFMTQKPSTNTSNNNSPQIISFGNPTSSFISDHDHNSYYYKYNTSTANDHPDIMSLVEDKTFSFCTSTSNSSIVPSINLDDSDDDQDYINRSTGIRVPNGKNVNSRQSLCHVQAKRKRRERLSALFISLSRVVPGLKKLDRISALEDAIKHMTELQERLKILEAEEDLQSFLKGKSPNTYILGDDGDYSMAETYDCDTCSPRNLQTSNNVNNGAPEDEKDALHDIKVKMLGKNVLIKIMCDKKYYECILSMSNLLQKLNLTILDTRVLLFGGCAIDITFAAQMESQFSTTVNDLIQYLQRTIVQSQK